jgi:hypothetical protein
LIDRTKRDQVDSDVAFVLILAARSQGNDATSALMLRVFAE